LYRARSVDVFKLHGYIRQHHLAVTSVMQ